MADAAVFDPDRAAEAGAAFGQRACTLPDGGLLISSSRLVEFNFRAAILIAPGLFRLDLTPQQETLGVLPRPLTDHQVHWVAEESAWDGYRDQTKTEPLELRGVFDLPDGPVLAWVHVLSFTDRDASAAHFVAKAELRPAPEEAAAAEPRPAAEEATAAEEHAAPEPPSTAEEAAAAEPRPAAEEAAAAEPQPTTEEEAA